MDDTSGHYLSWVLGRADGLAACLILHNAQKEGFAIVLVPMFEINARIVAMGSSTRRFGLDGLDGRKETSILDEPKSIRGPRSGQDITRRHIWNRMSCIHTPRSAKDSCSPWVWLPNYICLVISSLLRVQGAETCHTKESNVSIYASANQSKLLR